MSDTSPYVRSALTATRLSVPDPSLLVDLWMERFLEGGEEADYLTSARAYDILALLGRLERCRPYLLEATSRQDAYQRELSRLRARLVELTMLALGVPAPDGWLREAEALAAACDDGASDDHLADWAGELLGDLDDADLVAWAARAARCPNLALEEGLSRCTAWLAENPDRFFPAGVLVQGVGQVLRPDLLAEDADLAATADKFVILLDALEDAEAALASRASPSVVTTHRAAERAKAWSWMPGPTFALAAQVPAASGLTRCRWRSPEGTFRAVLVANPADPSATHVRVNFLMARALAAELAGQTAWLAGCPALIDAEGDADFTLADLAAARAAGLPDDLAVGPNRILWIVDLEG